MPRKRTAGPDGLAFDDLRLYSTAELEELLAGRCTLATLVELTGAIPVSRGLWLGARFNRGLEKLAGGVQIQRHSGAKGVARKPGGKRRARVGKLEPFGLEDVG